MIPRCDKSLFESNQLLTAVRGWEILVVGIGMEEEFVAGKGIHGDGDDGGDVVLGHGSDEHVEGFGVGFVLGGGYKLR
jgi:hypothetical protein